MLASEARFTSGPTMQGFNYMLGFTTLNKFGNYIGANVRVTAISYPNWLASRAWRYQTSIKVYRLRRSSSDNPVVEEQRRAPPPGPYVGCALVIPGVQFLPLVSCGDATASAPRPSNSAPSTPRSPPRDRILASAPDRRYDNSNTKLITNTSPARPNRAFTVNEEHTKQTQYHRIRTHIHLKKRSVFIR
ncbi:hypothetical protein EVAR_656_1 [Eumeta japonica]|uniref:Uncharacterized protein n=1 Tax=Eumeta variegata TaxID=151549 RepID=A0A4C1SBI3_EUMVA|nr:hypothetical protein EVAR_656_1 [Eumeta japonica]